MEFLNWHNQQILTESGNSKNTCGACTDISMHNTSWAALCSGQMGVPLQWHAHDAWNQTGKTDIEDFYANFNALASFVDGLDFENHKYRPSVQNEDELIFDKGNNESNGNTIEMDIEIFVMQNDNSGINEKSDRGFGWVHHKKANGYYNLGIYSQNPFCYINRNLGGDPPLINEIPDEVYAYNLNGFKTGEYYFDLYDTKTGQIFHSFQSTLTENSADLFGVLALEIPHVPLYYNDDNDKRLDYAFKFWHVSNSSSTFRINSMNEDSLAKPQEITSERNNSSNETHFIVHVYPNPTHEKLFIKTEGGKISKIEITEPTGRLLLNNFSLDSNNLELDLKNISNGCYFLKVFSPNNKIKILKIIKQ